MTYVDAAASAIHLTRMPIACLLTGQRMRHGIRLIARHATVQLNITHALLAHEQAGKQRVLLSVLYETTHLAEEALDGQLSLRQLGFQLGIVTLCSVVLFL